MGDPTFCRDLAVTHPNLLSRQPLFLTSAHATRMSSIITAIEAVARLPAYQAAVLAHAPAISRFDPGPRSVFMGYDFHLGPDGPQLIEINTNAGGALICVKARDEGRQQRAEIHRQGARLCHFRTTRTLRLKQIRVEWRLPGKTTPLRTIAIVDQSPPTQYLFDSQAAIARDRRPEFRADMCWSERLPLPGLINPGKVG